MPYRFFEHSLEAEHQIDRLREFISGDDWNLVDEKNDQYIEIIKRQLRKMDDEYAFIADYINDGSDARHLMHHFENDLIAKPAIEILLRCYRIKNVDIPDKDKNDAQKTCEEIKTWTDKLILQIIQSRDVAIKIGERKRNPTGLIGVEAIIRHLLKVKGLSTSANDIWSFIENHNPDSFKFQDARFMRFWELNVEDDTIHEREYYDKEMVSVKKHREMTKKAFNNKVSTIRKKFKKSQKSSS